MTEQTLHHSLLENGSGFAAPFGDRRVWGHVDRPTPTSSTGCPPALAGNGIVEFKTIGVTASARECGNVPPRTPEPYESGKASRKC
jgi:hypothetical protein